MNEIKPNLVLRETVYCVTPEMLVELLAENIEARSTVVANCLESTDRNYDETVETLLRLLLNIPWSVKIAVYLNWGGSKVEAWGVTVRETVEDNRDD